MKNRWDPGFRHRGKVFDCCHQEKAHSETLFENWLLHRVAFWRQSRSEEMIDYAVGVHERWYLRLRDVHGEM